MAARKTAGKRTSVKTGPAPNEVLVTILGSGPSVAAFQAILQANEADGLMYHNAVANQQKTNLLGMAMTAKCVSYLLGSPPKPSRKR